MSAPKGYPSQTSLNRGKADFATVEPVREQQHGLSVNAHLYVYVVGTDAAEANSTTSVINATAHNARIGDVIRFTSGTFNNTEVKVEQVTTNTITLVQDMASAIATGVTFEILRPKYPVVGSDGSISVTTTPGPLLFTLDGSDQEVTEDTVTPANNRPLPVKLVSFTGDINVTADALDISSTDVGPNYDAIRIGDGTERLSITAANQAEVAVTAALPAGTNNIGDVDVVSSVLPTGAATEASLSAINGKLNSLGQKTMANSVPVVIASDQSAIPVSGTVSTTEQAVVANGGVLPAEVKVVAGYDGSNVRVLSTSASGVLQATVATALPAGTNNIGDVDVLTLPAITAATNSIRIGDGTDLANVTASNQLEVAVTAALPAGSNNIGTVSLSSLDVVDFLDTPLLIASSTNIPASASTPLTVVASLAAAVSKMQILDTTGEYIGIYADPAGTPVLLAVSGPGSDQTIECTIPAATVIGVRNMKNATISVGEYCINFIG